MNWGHMIVGAGKFEICRAGQQARNLGRSCLVLRQILLFQETLVFTLKAFSWLDAIHDIIKGNLLYLKSTDYRC